MDSVTPRSSDDHSRLVRSSVPCPKHKCPLCREERSLLRLNSARWDEFEMKANIDAFCLTVIRPDSFPLLDTP